MALHQDIYWLGRQWAVTGNGMQALNQRLLGQFDIGVIRLWDHGLVEALADQAWLNVEDFNKALAVARTHFPGVLQEAPPPAIGVPEIRDLAAPPALLTPAETPAPAIPYPAKPLPRLSDLPKFAGTLPRQFAEPAPPPPALPSLPAPPVEPPKPAPLPPPVSAQPAEPKPAKKILIASPTQVTLRRSPAPAAAKPQDVPQKSPPTLTLNLTKPVALKPAKPPEAAPFKLAEAAPVPPPEPVLPESSTSKPPKRLDLAPANMPEISPHSPKPLNPASPAAFAPARMPPGLQSGPWPAKLSPVWHVRVRPKGDPA